MTDAVYMDANATMPISAAARSALEHALRALGNPSSVHRFGRAARALVDQAREQVAKLVGARAQDVVFTSSGTEANNLAIASRGDRALIVPYVMPGFKLARRVIDLWRTEASGPTDIMVLMNHGLFTWGETAKEAYDLMIEAVRLAEEFLRAHDAFEWPLTNTDPLVDRVIPQATLRKKISELQPRLAGARKQMDDPDEVRKLEAELAAAQAEIEKLKSA